MSRYQPIVTEWIGAQAAERGEMAQQYRCGCREWQGGGGSWVTKIAGGLARGLAAPGAGAAPGLPAFQSQRAKLPRASTGSAVAQARRLLGRSQACVPGRTPQHSHLLHLHLPHSKRAQLFSGRRDAMHLRAHAAWPAHGTCCWPALELRRVHYCSPGPPCPAAAAPAVGRLLAVHTAASIGGLKQVARSGCNYCISATCSERPATLACTAAPGTSKQLHQRGNAGLTA
jgi:hypothetical protein